ncbi:hypothetical protein CSUB01_03597 [Colletotrichum sublineola]|uniref:Uncharacterized protein n=1 Tax=Colletotrichum sublineola TaxID=1173701 RepID=A0A066XHR2_COLSU|nr:hypothetical protein CSUB01_03597 [Colletotrichum sublineola]
MSNFPKLIPAFTVQVRGTPLPPLYHPKLNSKHALLLPLPSLQILFSDIQKPQRLCPEWPFTSRTDPHPLQIHLDAPTQIGVVAVGSSQFHAAFLPNTGLLRSEPDYPIKVDAVFVHGADYLRGDPDGHYVRLEVSSVLKDKATGAAIRFDYTGTIDVSGPAGTVLKGLPGAKTTDFGDACECPFSGPERRQKIIAWPDTDTYVVTHAKFETGHEALREIQNKVYVGSGRFVVEEGKPVVVEYKISEVAA